MAYWCGFWGIVAGLAAILPVDFTVSKEVAGSGLLMISALLAAFGAGFSCRR